MPENIWFSVVFRRYKMRTLVINGFTVLEDAKTFRKMLNFKLRMSNNYNVTCSYMQGEKT